MTVIVFAGPSIAASEARALLDAEYRPPAAQGDVYRATLDRPRAIGLIDGYFGGVPSVWHKEILWAMARGIHVFGAASMGALRAAELYAFGMVGVGAIFAAYRDGVLEDDDEVAVIHGPAEAGYPACSEAMVNLRATLEAAAAAGAIAVDCRSHLLRIGKALHFTERDWPRILAEAGADGASAAELAALRAWLPAGRIDQKRRDARAMLGVMVECLALDPVPKQVEYVFEHTDKWDDLVSQVEGARGISGQEDASVAALLEEVKLERSGRYHALHQVALLRAVAERETRRRGFDPGEEQIEVTVEAFRRERGLLSRKRTEAWLAENRLELGSFREFLAGEARLRRFVATTRAVTAAHLLDELRAEGEFGRLAARAADKRRVLVTCRAEAPDQRDLGIGADELIGWFLQRRGEITPGMDVDDCALAFGFEDRDAFLQAMAREYCYAVRSRN